MGTVERNVGWLLVALGAGAIAVGLIALAGGLSWFGRLPGDLRFGSDRTRVYVPITSMVLVSVVLSVVLTLIGLFRR